MQHCLLRGAQVSCNCNEPPPLKYQLGVASRLISGHTSSEIQCDAAACQTRWQRLQIGQYRPRNPQ